MTREELMEKAIESIMEADEDLAEEVLDAGAAAGITAVELLQEGFSKGMNELGDQFGRGEVFLPELIFATEVMEIVTKRVDMEDIVCPRTQNSCWRIMGEYPRT